MSQPGGDDLATLQAAERRTRLRAFWSAVGPGAPPERLAAFTEAHAEWKAAKAALDAAGMGDDEGMEVQPLFGGAS